MKVTNVKKINGSIITKGKLVLTYNEKYLPEIGMIGNNNVHHLFMWTQEHTNNIKSLPEYLKTKAVLPIIISETEELNKGDKVLIDNRIMKSSPKDYSIETIENIENGWIFTKEQPDVGSNPETTKKILAMPENFSPDSRQEIIECKLKDRDDVYIRCDYVDSVKVALLGEQEAEYEIDLFNDRVDIITIEKSWDDVFVLPSHYTEVKELFFEGRGNHSVGTLEDICESQQELIHQLRVRMQNAIDNYHPPTKKQD